MPSSHLFVGMPDPSKKESQHETPPDQLSERLLLIRQRVDDGYYDSEQVIEEIVDAFIETQSSRRALWVDHERDSR